MVFNFLASFMIKYDYSFRTTISLSIQPLLLPYNNWNNRIATLRFVEDIPLKESHPSYQTLLAVEEGLSKLKAIPMLICWGDDDFCFTPNFRREWERRFPDANVHAWKDIGHYVMEDARDRVLPLMREFLEK